MAAQFGRTVSEFTKLYLSNGGSMINIPIDTLGDLGLDYAPVDMSAWQDAVKGVLISKPDFELTFGGPLDNIATTGVHAVLSALVGAMTALSFDVKIGIRHEWEAGEPQFGVSATVATNNGVCVTNYKVVGGSRYTAAIKMLAPCVTAPAFGTAAEVVPA